MANTSITPLLEHGTAFESHIKSMYGTIARLGVRYGPVVYDLLVPATRSYYKGVIESAATERVTHYGLKAYKKAIRHGHKFRYKSKYSR